MRKGIDTLYNLVHNNKKRKQSSDHSGDREPKRGKPVIRFMMLESYEVNLNRAIDGERAALNGQNETHAGAHSFLSVRFLIGTGIISCLT